MRASVIGGTCRHANTPLYEVCGKTGTAQNRGRDHSAFMGFAPMNNPKIAVAVYVENGGFGASFGVPIGALIIEQYLMGKLSESSQAKATAMQQRHIDYGFKRKMSRADSLRLDSIKRINHIKDSIKREEDARRKALLGQDGDENDRQGPNGEQPQKHDDQPIIRMDEETTPRREKQHKTEGGGDQPEEKEKPSANKEDANARQESE